MPMHSLGADRERKSLFARVLQKGGEGDSLLPIKMPEKEREKRLDGGPANGGQRFPKASWGVEKEVREVGRGGGARGGLNGSHFSVKGREIRPV